jgi:AraC-like DNA-binding protein
MAAFFELASGLLDAPPACVLANAHWPELASQIARAGCAHRARNVILRNFQNALDHHEMAGLAHMAPASFSRLFLVTTHKTFTQFLKEVPIDLACRLLDECEKVIAEIALASGFNNLSHFNRQFHRHFGCRQGNNRAAIAGLNRENREGTKIIL